MLIKFANKCLLRMFLRQNSLQNSKKSSLYKIENNYYVVVLHESVGGDDNCIVNSLHAINNIYSLQLKENSQQKVLDVEVINHLSNAEKTLLMWAISEIEQTLKFIELESQSFSKISEKNQDSFIGRAIFVDNTEVIRTFDVLFEVMAIVNYTADSFSDGGQYNSLERMSSQIISQVYAGATIIDLGVESTRHDAKILTWIQEIEILQSVLPQVIKLKQLYKFALSIDTYHGETVNWLLQKQINFDIINDVSGNIAIEIVKKILDVDKKYIAMHSLNVPADKNIYIPLALDPITVINQFIQTKIEQIKNSGVSMNKICHNVIFDPGIGFGKTKVQDWYIIKNLSKINTVNSELLLGHSRKSYFSHVLNKLPAMLDQETAIVALQLANIVDVIRIHDTISAINASSIID